VSSSRKLSTFSDSSAAHDNVVFVLHLQLGHLVTLLPLAVSHVTLAVCASLHSSVAKGSVVLWAVVVFTITDSVLVATISIVVLWGMDAGACVVIRVPPAVAVMISI